MKTWVNEAVVLLMDFCLYRICPSQMQFIVLGNSAEQVDSVQRLSDELAKKFDIAWAQLALFFQRFPQIDCGFDGLQATHRDEVATVVFHSVQFVFDYSFTYIDKHRTEPAIRTHRSHITSFSLLRT